MKEEGGLQAFQAEARSMNSNSLLASFAFGMVGMGFFMYGKKAGRMVPLGAGVALMVAPYFIPNLMAMIAVCCLLTVLPWVLRGV
jgi:hypothetical protein